MVEPCCCLLAALFAVSNVDPPGSVSRLRRSGRQPVPSSEVRRDWSALRRFLLRFHWLDFVVQELRAGHAGAPEVFPGGQSGIFGSAKVEPGSSIEVIEQQVLGLDGVGVHLLLVNLVLINFYPNLLSEDLIVFLSPRGDDFIALGLSNPSFDSEPIIIGFIRDLVGREGDVLCVLLGGIFSYLVMSAK